MNKISASEMLKIFDNQWADAKDVMAIGGCGYTKALKIKNDIKRDLESKGYRVSRNLIPMEKVIEYFNININYLKKVAKEN